MSMIMSLKRKKKRLKKKIKTENFTLSVLQWLKDAIAALFPA